MQFIYRKSGCTCITSMKRGMQKKKLVMLTAHGHYYYYFQLQSEACNLCWCIPLLLSTMISIIIIIIMYIYHALINALSAHTIHINLNVIFYTHVEHNLTKTIYIKYYTEK